MGRWRWSRACIAVFAGIGVLVASATDAQAYCRSTTCDPQAYECPVVNECPRGGPPLSWRALPLQYRFQRDGSAKLDMDLAREAARRAFDTWSEVRCANGKRTSLRFEEGPDITKDKPLKRKSQGAEPFGIYFRDDAWPYTGGDDALAVTSQTFGMFSGYIEYADIEINTSERKYAVTDDEDGIDLQAVFTHEIGHYIGLAHSNVDASIMVARYCQSADRCGKDVATARALADDDVEAVCALYPPSGIAGVLYEEPSGCATTATPGREKTSWPIVVAIGAIAIAFARARRTRSTPSSL